MNINLRKDLNDIYQQTFDMKVAILKAVRSDDGINKSKLYDYINAIKGFVNLYRDYSNLVKKEMMEIDPVENESVITYQSAKKYIYSNNDYSSILPYTDAIIKGINDDNFKNTSYINAFTTYMISKCFKKLDTSCEELIDSVSGLVQNKDLGSTEEISKYNIVKDYDIFNIDDSYELITSISNTISFICDSINSDNDIIDDDNKYPLFINAIFEYINYSLSVYGAKVFVINEYVQSYKPSPITESYSEEMKNYVWVMKKTDEIIARDYTEVEHFCKRIRRFCGELGIEFEDNELATAKYPDTKLKSNKLYNEISDNELIKFLSDIFNWVDERRILEFNTELRALYYSNKQSLQSNITPKDKLMYTIKNIASGDKSLGSLKYTLEDFALCSIKILYLINSRIRDLLNMESNNTEKPFMTLSQDIKNSETFKILGELYRDIATVILYKMKDIEIRYNKLKNKSMNALASKLEIDDYSSTDSMRLATPEMLRNPIEFRDDFIRDEFEYLQLESYDIMWKYGLEDDPYYTNFNEAVSLSELINKVLSLLQVLKRRFLNFFNDKQFKVAVEWVKTHQNNLTSGNFKGTIRLLPYTKDIDISFMNNFANSISSLDVSTIKDQTKAKEFYTKLYTIKGKDLYKLFTDEKIQEDRKVGRYVNFILFNIDPFSDQKPKEIDIKDNQIKEYLNFWIENVSGSEETLKALNESMDKVINAIKNLKTKIVSISGENNSTNTQNSNDQNKQNDQNKNQDNNEENKSVNLDEFLISIMNANRFLIAVLYSPITKALKDQYSYIQDAYTLSRQQQ